MSHNNIDKQYFTKSNKAIIKDFDEKYPNTLNEANLSDILETLRQKIK